MKILGENFDERYGLDEYDVYDPFEGEEDEPAEESELKPNGFGLIKVGKNITLCLWSKSREELEAVKEFNMRVVPCYEDGRDEYLYIDGNLIAVGRA